ncbi:MAG: hypothetical protein EON90_14565 [Brevundimonas sp.]|nr:MAG: hypothetical protein EON90_14565 [Brevundimonas sp.]
MNNVYNGGSNAESGASSIAGARGAGNARAGGSGWLYGGGGGGSAYVTVEQPYPTTINGLKVEGGVARANRVAYEAWRRIEKRVVIRALCIDDRNVPHPASQVRPDRDVGLDYEGELYRCLAGTSLQYTWAEWSGSENFEHGESFTCRKGEALWYGRRRLEGHAGQGGQGGGEGEFAPGLECRPQKAERDCNERSLLRRYGAGIKVLTWVREEMYTEYREEYAEESGIVVSGASFVMDGGVGGRVF